MQYLLLRPATYLLLLSTYFLSIASQASDPGNITTSDLRAQERNLYVQAKQAYKNNNIDRYQSLKARLTNYPLYPYLEYPELSRELSTLSAKKYATKYHADNAEKRLRPKIDRFISQHPNSYLGNLLQSKWLAYLASVQNWRDYKRYYSTNVKKAKLQCLYLQARINTEKVLPATDIQRLWLNAQSLPDECDPAFLAWERAGHLSADLLWERHKLAINKKKYSLAAYLQKKMDSGTRYLAALYEDVHRKPEKVSRVKALSRVSSSSPNQLQGRVKDIIYNGLYRYAYSQPVKTLTIFQRLKKSYSFDQKTTDALNQRIAKNLIRKKQIDSAIGLVSDLPDENREELIERLLRHFLQQQDWQYISHWVDQLPKELAESDRWQYWKARALEAMDRQGDSSDDTKSYEDIYTTLAMSRSFYGFLSADKQNTAYNFEDKPAPIDTALIKKVRLSPAILRAKEFFLLREMHRARTEWSYGVKSLSKKEFLAAGQLAHLWGWNRKAIEAMAKASYWDDLTIRFPLVYTEIISKKARKNDVPQSLVFAIARQESAWEFDARSRVGARGLMQIMPATAKETARKARIGYNKRKLYEPNYNITLGSFYISGLLKQHDNNRALAVAAYNAGPHRVKGWRAKTKASLPIDVWIEIIPFKETRKYVQNVLSYEVIYNYRQGQESSLLTLAEANSIL